jgi:GatB/GatE catalytic domain
MRASRLRNVPDLRLKRKNGGNMTESTYRIQGMTGEWEVVIGLEVHAQVTSNAKLFSGASAAYGGEPNSHVSLVDAAMPGMLPVVSRECIRQPLFAVRPKELFLRRFAAGLPDFAAISPNCGRGRD